VKVIIILTIYDLNNKPNLKNEFIENPNLFRSIKKIWQSTSIPHETHR